LLPELGEVGGPLGVACPRALRGGGGIVRAAGGRRRGRDRDERPARDHAERPHLAVLGSLLLDPQEALGELDPIAGPQGSPEDLDPSLVGLDPAFRGRRGRHGQRVDHGGGDERVTEHRDLRTRTFATGRARASLVPVARVG
jgi:hypothetical protein